MSLFTFLLGIAIGFAFGWYTGTHPGWTAPMVAYIKSQPWKSKPKA